MKRGIIWIYSLVVILFLYILYYFRNSDHFMGAIAFVLSIGFFFAADNFFKLNFKRHHYIILVLMAMVGLLLSPFYLIFPYYDKVLHFVNPFLACFLIFYLVDKRDLKFSEKIFFTFTILICLITFAEIAEFTLDSFFDLKLQGVFAGDLKGVLKQIGEGELIILQGKNTDTMIDMIMGVLGSLLFISIKLVSFKKRKSKIN